MLTVFLDRENISICWKLNVDFWGAKSSRGLHLISLISVSLFKALRKFEFEGKSFSLFSCCRCAPSRKVFKIKTMEFRLTNDKRPRTWTTPKRWEKENIFQPFQDHHLTKKLTQLKWLICIIVMLACSFFSSSLASNIATLLKMGDKKGEIHWKQKLCK